jgi:hypothetical protein
LPVCVGAGVVNCAAIGATSAVMAAKVNFILLLFFLLFRTNNDPGICFL